MASSTLINILNGPVAKVQFAKFVRIHGKQMVLAMANHYLGDWPDITKLGKLSKTIDFEENYLYEMATSHHAPSRRVARAVLQIRLKNADTLLSRGLDDPLSRIRCDTARFYKVQNSDRNRFYNRLVKLIREDPCTNVRKAAGKRLTDSFADFYSIDMKSQPDFSRMLMLDSLGGKARKDEETALESLFDNNSEIAFRAAYQLDRWNTLPRLFEENNPDSNRVLERCAELGISDFLGNLKVPTERTEYALHLAKLAGRNDLVKIIYEKDVPPSCNELDKPVDIPAIKVSIERLLWLDNSDYDEGIKHVIKEHDQGDAFRKAIDIAFPSPDRDAIGVILFNIAKHAGWKEWQHRCVAGIMSGDPDICIAAADALRVLHPKQAMKLIPSLLDDSVSRVRQKAAEYLMALPFPKGRSPLAVHLNKSGDYNIMQSFTNRDQTHLAKFIVDHAKILESRLIGQLLDCRLTLDAVKVLQGNFDEDDKMAQAAKIAGPKFGEDFLTHWSYIESKQIPKVLEWIKASGWPEILKKSFAKDHISLLAPLTENEIRLLLEDVLPQLKYSIRKKLPFKI